MLSRWPVAFMESDKKIAISRYKTGYGMNIHAHVYFEIEYVLSGKCQQNFMKESHEFSRGDIALFKCDSRHEFYASSELEVFTVKIKYDFLPEIYNKYADEFDSACIIHLPPSEVNRIENLLFSIEKEFNMQNELFWMQYQVT